jgi:hypothetical protein
VIIHYFPGQPGVRIGNRKGRHFSEENFKRLMIVARELAGMNFDGIWTRKIEDMMAWYDPDHDFNNLKFRLDGHVFLVQKYKIFTVLRDPEPGCRVTGWRGLKLYFRSSEYSVIDFFRMDRHVSTSTRWQEPYRGECDPEGARVQAVD